MSTPAEHGYQTFTPAVTQGEPGSPPLTNSAAVPPNIHTGPITYTTPNTAGE